MRDPIPPAPPDSASQSTTPGEGALATEGIRVLDVGTFIGHFTRQRRLRRGDPRRAPHRMGENRKYDPVVFLDFDYTVLMPRRSAVGG